MLDRNLSSGVRTATALAFFAILLFVSACTTTMEESKFKPPVYPPPPEKPRFIWEHMLRSSADIKEESAEDALRRMVTGEKPAGEGLAKPYGVAVRRERVFVGDTASRIVLAFDFVEGRSFKKGASDGPGALYKPFGLVTDAAGNLYVVDGTTKNVKMFSWDGEYIRTIAKKGDLSRPTGVTVTPDGTKLFVVDTGGVQSLDHRVRVYDPRTGEHLYDFGRRGKKPGEFNLPNNAAIGPHGKIYIVDGGNFRVQVFKQDGTYVMTIGSIGRQFGQFSRPKGIGVDKDGNIYVADAAFGNFQIFDPNGRLLLFVGERGGEGTAGQFFLPAGLTVDEDGRVYMVDQFYRKVEIFRPARLNPDEGYLGGQFPRTTQQPNKG